MRHVASIHDGRDVRGRRAAVPATRVCNCCVQIIAMGGISPSPGTPREGRGGGQSRTSFGPVECRGHRTTRPPPQPSPGGPGEGARPVRGDVLNRAVYYPCHGESRLPDGPATADLLACRPPSRTPMSFLRRLACWATGDRVRTSPRDGRLLRLPVGACVQVGETVAQVIARELVAGTGRSAPEVRYTCQSVDSTLHLTAVLNSAGGVDLSLQDGVDHRTLHDVDVVAYG